MIPFIMSAILAVTGGATATAPAVRLDPPTVEQQCNAQAYAWLTPEPVHACYRLVAAELGWDPATVDKWEAFLVEDVVRNESGFCWRTRGRQRVTETCEPYTPKGVTPAEDTGFFQLTRAWYGPSGILCTDHGYCGWQSIAQSPYHSMRAGLLAVMVDGKGPWCFNAYARNIHQSCGTVPRQWP